MLPMGVGLWNVWWERVAHTFIALPNFPNKYVLIGDWMKKKMFLMFYNLCDEH